ncbi:MAG: rhomboid family intramembrane serine protease [Flavobacteriales bacterium]|nr:rhomboid family intramembrane serine protease [Flavobacteriales bacterium]
MNMDFIAVVLVLFNVLISMKGFNDRIFFEKYLFQTGSIINGKEYIRMISSGFLHAGWGHLAFNMIALWSFGGLVEDFIGTIPFVILYFISLVVGNLTSLYLHREELFYRAVGASGAVSGVVFASILLYPQGSVIIFLIPFPIPSWLFGIIYLIISIYGMREQRDNIGHEAHFGGAIAGLIMTLWFRPSSGAEFIQYFIG